MPVEIRELLIQARLDPPEESGTEGDTKLLTESDLESIKQDIVEEISGRDDMLSDILKRNLIEECLLAVRAMLEEKDRR